MLGAPGALSPTQWPYSTGTEAEVLYGMLLLQCDAAFPFFVGWFAAVLLLLLCPFSFPSKQQPANKAFELSHTSTTHACEMDLQFDCSSTLASSDRSLFYSRAQNMAKTYRF